MADRPTLLTTEQAAAILGASHFILETWRWKRLGPPWIKVSRSCVRYDLAKLTEWLTQRTVKEIRDVS